MRNYDFMNSEPQYDTTPYMVNEADVIKDFDHTSIFRHDGFTESMKYFDTDDDMTRYILLSVNEADQSVVMQSLANKLYENIVDKVDKIDFGTIPLSKGDITKIENYDRLVDCVRIMSDIIQRYNQNTNCIETIATAIQNMIDNTDLFTKAYALNVEMPIIIYNTMVLSIVSATSLMISSCVDFIKSADKNGFDISLNRAELIRTKDALLFKDLEKFNKLCANGTFDKMINGIIAQNSKNLFGATAGATIGIITLILSFIPLMRELIFFFYYSRCKVSDYFDAQATLLDMNAYNIENNLARDEKERKEIATKQRSISDKFKKISNFFKIKSKTAESDSAKDINKLDSHKYKHNEVLDGIPDSSNSVLF